MLIMKNQSADSTIDMRKIESAKKNMMKLFKGNDPATLKLIEPLVQNACFMQFTLRQIQQDILACGTVDSYQNGKEQSGFKISASVQAYNAMVKNYNTVINKLSQYVVNDESAGDKFEVFMAEYGN